MHDNEFLGRLDFNQHNREINVFDILLEVQSPLKQADKRLFCPGALNSKTAFSHRLFSLFYGYAQGSFF